MAKFESLMINFFYKSNAFTDILTNEYQVLWKIEHAAFDGSFFLMNKNLIISRIQPEDNIPRFHSGFYCGNKTTFEVEVTFKPPE